MRTEAVVAVDGRFAAPPAWRREMSQSGGGGEAATAGDEIRSETLGDVGRACDWYLKRPEYTGREAPSAEKRTGLAAIIGIHML